MPSLQKSLQTSSILQLSEGENRAPRPWRSFHTPSGKSLPIVRPFPPNRWLQRCAMGICAFSAATWWRKSLITCHRLPSLAWKENNSRVMLSSTSQPPTFTLSRFGSPRSRSYRFWTSVLFPHPFPSYGGTYYNFLGDFPQSVHRY